MNVQHDFRDKIISHQTAQEKIYDAVIVGSGIAGSLIALELACKKKNVLILEAGPADSLDGKGYNNLVNTFYTAVSKDNNSPYKVNINAPMPRSSDARRLGVGQVNADSYLVQNGPFESDSTYARVIGGTTNHWEGKTPRMLPEDFKMKKNFKKGLDWPFEYKDILPYYNKAEYKIGVSGDVANQTEIGVVFDDNYVYPMQEIPPSYLDKIVGDKLNGTKVAIGEERFKLKVSTFPQARNGIPNGNYKPVGAVNTHQDNSGERCQGNTNCVPICPVQAKYDARKTLVQALLTGYVDLLTKTVASKVCTCPDNQRVKKIEYKTYDDIQGNEFSSGSVTGKVFVLAANAIENARLMLASNLPAYNDYMGRHLMDHPYVLAWGLLPENAGVMRGTSCTSGISTLRRGNFRNNQAAFAIDIHNDGWGWATGSPYSDLLDLVNNKNKFGAALKTNLIKQVSRQLLLANMVEMLPEYSNRVTVNPNYKDRLGNLRPILSWSIPDYSLEGVAYARQLSKQIFQRLGAEDCTAYNPLNYGYTSFNGEGYEIRGGNHLSGTHLMGDNKLTSVVNPKQRSWMHDNLYLVGAGSMPSIGTSNTTLTMAAITLMTAEDILKVI